MVLGEPGSNLGVDFFLFFYVNSQSIDVSRGKKNMFLLSVRLERGKNCADSWNVSRHLLGLQMSFALTARSGRHLPGFASDGCSLDNWSKGYLHGSVRCFFSFPSSGLELLSFPAIWEARLQTVIPRIGRGVFLFPLTTMQTQILDLRCLSDGRTQ